MPVWVGEIPHYSTQDGFSPSTLAWRQNVGINKL